MTTQVLVALAPAVLGAAVAPEGSPEQFTAAAITRTGHLEFEGAMATIFDLFTPQGERHWAKGWDPEVLYPRDRDISEGMVFRTRDHGDMVLTWTVVRYDPTHHLVAYNVVAPDFVVRNIEVRCRPAGAGRVEVEVTDSYVGLSRHGNLFVEQLTEANYAAKMGHWKEAIGAYLVGVAKSAH